MLQRLYGNGGKHCLALGDATFLTESKTRVPTFKPYADQWLTSYAETECKPSTRRSYEQLLRVHITPRFGSKLLTEIRRDEVKRFLADLSQVTHDVKGQAVPKFSRNTLRLIVSALRTVLNAAVEDGLIESNPAAKMGKFARSEKPAHQASAMTRTEAEAFLSAVREVCPDWYPFFLTALRAGLRKGELIALKWGDIQFGESPEDPNRYILVQRNYSDGRFTSPKSKKSRRVDLSKHLRNVLLELRDKCMQEAVMAGRTSIADGLVFPSRVGTVIKPDNIARRYMEPALEKAGLRRFRFHDCRHTFGSLLIQDGASLAYVKDQMGHSSIQITVDTYGHLIPGANIAWVDRLDSETSRQQSAPETHQPESDPQAEFVEVVENNWLPPRDSNPDMLIQS
ncbi:MAG TPA: site-specific integrase [Terriglobales bacterium]|nr:site-specific integrase [Terriglobales bacterium]